MSFARRLNDINDTGTFVGVALVDGVEHDIAGQLVPIPEPPSVVLLGVGLLALSAMRFRSIWA